jgi:DmsE family decaheme c-type cytochrome
MEDLMSCVDCHDPHGTEVHKRSGLLAMSRLNDSCAKCHQEQTRPFIFEHEALREGCVSCHQPHGSINDKMLTEHDPNLCLKCHAQVAMGGAGDDIAIGQVSHRDFLQSGTCWSAGCHTAVHGSNVDRLLRY